MPELRHFQLDKRLSTPESSVYYNLMTREVVVSAPPRRPVFVRRTPGLVLGPRLGTPSQRCGGRRRASLPGPSRTNRSYALPQHFDCVRTEGYVRVRRSSLGAVPRSRATLSLCRAVPNPVFVRLATNLLTNRAEQGMPGWYHDSIAVKGAL
jgi:hypothetical protein